ncbi:MAG: ATP-binding protein [Actinomycetes bacterium]
MRDITERLAAQAEAEELRAEAERARLERRLAQAQRLESLGQLVGGVAHDFNNMLNIVSGYTNMARTEVAAAAVTDSRWVSVVGDLDQVQQASDRAAQLTHQLLSFARREVTHPESLFLNDVVTGVEPMLRQTLGEHIDLLTGLSQDLWPVLADSVQLEQVLVNLAVNARDAMPAGGKLAIDTANLDVDAHYAETMPEVTPGRYVRLRVSDTGTGMDRETLDRVFEPFFTTKPQGEGTGLGLATMYGIVTQAGGHAQVYSEPGHGTTITVLLPVTDQDSVLTPDGSSEDLPSGHGEAVLVVEDEAPLRDLVVRILTEHGYHVRTVTTAPDALQDAGQLDQPLDLLLTDVVMPTMLGTEVAENVRALRPDVHVLYMTGYAQPTLAAQINLDPTVDVVEKPFTKATLLAKVHTALTQQGGQPPHEAIPGSR